MTDLLYYLQSLLTTPVAWYWTLIAAFLGPMCGLGVALLWLARRR